jgi:large subunit ribosomal protein L4
MPKKARRLARNSAILSKIQSNDIRVLEEIAIDQPKTKLMAGVFKALGHRPQRAVRPGRPQREPRALGPQHRPHDADTVDQLNAWDILKNRTLLVTRAGMEKILA